MEQMTPEQIEEACTAFRDLLGKRNARLRVEGRRDVEEMPWVNDPFVRHMRPSTEATVTFSVDFEMGPIDVEHPSALIGA
jgi:hypothetical protein